MNNKKFRKLVLSKVISGPFKPILTYDRYDNSVEFLATNDNYKTKRISKHLTVYYSRETNELIGVLVKGMPI